MGIKQNIKRIISCFLTMGLILLLLGYSAEKLENKESSGKYEPFFEQEEDFNVLFFGSSHVKYSVFPMELWGHYGIVSYNMGIEGQTLPATYWQMKNVLDYTSPELIVIDCYFLSKTSKLYDRMHPTWDGLPLSQSKIEAICDILNEEETDATPMEFFWDYILYHNRWDELQEADFNEEHVSTAKGCGYLTEIETGHEVTKISRENKLEENTIAIEYLEKMIQDCLDSGIDVLLTYLPFPAGEDFQKEANRVYDIAEKYDVNYINFLDLDLVNDKTDYADYGHLNLSGGRKVTEYLGQYIAEHYDITDQRTNETYCEWHADYADYRNEKSMNFKNFTSLDYYLLLLTDRDFLTFIEIHDPEILRNDYYIDLFQNIGINKDNISESTDLFIIQSEGPQISYLDNFTETDKDIASEFGRVRKVSAEDGTYRVYLDGQEVYAITSEQDLAAEIRIVVMDKDTHEMIDQSYFFKENDALCLYKKQ